MTRGDAYFHLLLAGCVVGGTLFAQSAGTALWNSHNQGVSTQKLDHRGLVAIPKVCASSCRLHDLHCVASAEVFR